MRLTLRTLLAYLDDVLDPANSKEIGQKIQDSPVALKTIERIRDVTRRRRINAPGINDSKLDPNSTAEYLDNTLDPNKVAGIEQICLDDDEYLAEVAACHQILTLVLGEPVDIPANTRERMYQLENQQESPDSAGSVAENQASQKMPEKLVTPITKKPEKVVPDYLKRDSFLQRYWPITLLLALGAGWLYVFMTDDTFNVKNQEIVKNTNPPVGQIENQANTDATKPASDNNTSVNNTSGTISTGAVVSSQNTKPETQSADPALSQPPVVVTENPVVANMNPVATVNQEMPKNDTPVAANNASDLNAPGLNTPASNPPTLIATPISPLFYRVNDDLLIHQRLMGDDWYAVESDQPLLINELIACPKPFRAVLEFPDTKVKLELDGGSVVQFLSPTKERDFGLEIKRGRVIVSRQDDSINSPIRMELIVGKHTWPITMSAGKMLLGFDVMPRLPEHLEESFGELTHRVSLKAGLGKTQIVLEDKTIQNLDGAQEISLVKLEKTVPRLREMNQPPLLSLQNSEWLKENDQLKSAVQKKQAREFLKEIDAGPEDAPLPVWLSITPLITEPNVKNADFATQTLALKCFKKGDHAEELIMCLARTPHEDAMKSAIDGLREWLANDPENRGVLKEELVKLFPDETSAILYQLLWGYNVEDLKNLETSLKLVDWLLHDDDCVRQLAFYHIERITGIKNNYHPLEAPGRREATVRRWRLQVEQDGGLVH